MKINNGYGFFKDLTIYLFLGLIILFQFWNFLIPKDKIYLSGDFVELLALRDYFYQQLRSGFLVLWDTHLATGMPYLMADLGAFYPPDFILGLLGIFHKIGWLQVLLAIHYWMAGVFTYLYTRQLGFFRTSALISALSFMMGGFLLANPHHRNLIQTFIWLPLILYFLDKALIRRKGVWAAIAGLTLGISFLAGHANFFYFILLFILFYYLYRVYLGIRERSFMNILQDTSYFFIMGLFCLGLSAVQLLPILSGGTASYRQTIDFGWKAYGSYPFLNLVSLFIPKWFIWTAEDLSDQLSYIGILPLILGFWAVFQSKTAKPIFLGLTAIFSLLAAFGQYTPIYKILYDILPGLHLFRIPARFNCLLTFSLAILSGYGCNLLLESSPQKRIKGLFKSTKIILYFSLGAGLLLIIAWFFLCVYQGKNGALSAPWGELVGSYIVFILLLGGSSVVILLRTKGVSLKGLKILMILLVSVDLLVASLNFGPTPGGHQSASNPLIISDGAKSLFEKLKEDKELYRISNTEGLLPPFLRYRENITAYDIESMPNYVSLQFPIEYLELYFHLEKNPKLFDMLNIKYHLGNSRPKNLSFPERIQIKGKFESQEFILKEPMLLSKVTVNSFLSFSEHIPQGTVVAQINLVKKGGFIETIPIRAGIETAEWAIDRPGANISHQKPQVADTWKVEGEGYEGHSYIFTVDFPHPLGIEKLNLQYLNPQGILEIKKIFINQKELKDFIKERFEFVAPAIYKNIYAFPRVFTIGRAKAIPSEKRRTEELGQLDPKEYVLLERLPSGYQDPSSSSFSTHETLIIRYTPHRILIQTKTEADKFLILSDTYNPYWKARIDQKPAPILKANYGLRGLYIPKGEHQVEFSFHYYPFYYGLIITCISLALLLAVSFFHIKKYH